MQFPSTSSSTCSFAVKRRRCCYVETGGARAAALVLLMSLIVSPQSADSFAIQGPSRSTYRRTYTSSATAGNSLLRASTTTGSSTSWSIDTGKPSSSSLASSSSSRFGVRKRVRAVLERAKQRTGVNNNSDDDLMVGQAASIGALSGADLVYQRKSPAAAMRNGTDTELVLQTPPSPQSASTATDSNNVKNYEKNNGKSASVVQEDFFVTADTGMADQVDPLPFQLPTLSQEQLRNLENGERIQEQSKMGREGSGYVVMDIPAPPEAVWECLLDFEAYPQNIGTVRSMQMFSNTHHLSTGIYSEKPVSPGTGRATRHYGIPSITKANFVLSKFQFNIAAVHQYRPHPDGHYMEFSLDKACKNFVLQDAKGIWYTESNAGGRPGVTRVWLLCQVAVVKALPSFIVDYTAKRAMPRATSWLQPLAEETWEQMQKTTSSSSSSQANGLAAAANGSQTNGRVPNGNGANGNINVASTSVPR